MNVYKNEEERLRIEAEKEAQIQKQVKELSTLDTLEEKLQYWTTYLKHRSLFKGIGKGEEKLNLLVDTTNRNERLEVVKAEISRLDATNEDFLSTRFRKQFYSRITETNDIELTKTKFIEKIEKHINSKEFPDIYTEYKLIGFKAYNGGRSIESKVEDLQSFSIGLKDRSFFKYTYEGYLLAELVSEIKNINEEEIKRIINTDTIEPQTSALVAALVLKHLGIVEKIAVKEDLSNEKVIELLNALFGGPMKASSISSSYRDRAKSTDKGRKEALKFLQKFGTLETIETFLSDWKKPK